MFQHNRLSAISCNWDLESTPDDLIVKEMYPLFWDRVSACHATIVSI